MKVIKSDKIISSPFGKETMLMNTDSGQYFILNKIGTLLWVELTSGRIDTSDLIKNIVDKYDENPEQIKSDIKVFIDSLLMADILQKA